MIDIEAIEKNYFYFDEPVPFELKKDKKVIYIYPITVRNSEYFLSSVGILTIDKNSLPDPKVISMSYLQFMCEKLFADKEDGQAYIYAMYNLMHLCLGLEAPAIKWINDRPYLCDLKQGVEISAKEFDSIKRIILYQNFLHYDDEYINPDLEKALAEQKELAHKNYEEPSLERKISIITSHSGLPKKDQLEMTFRSHASLFEEVIGEVDYTTKRNAAIIGGEENKIEHWVFKKKKDKYEGYVKSVDSFTKSIGGSRAIKSSDTSAGDKYIQQYNNFNI